MHSCQYKLDLEDKQPSKRSVNVRIKKVHKMNRQEFPHEIIPTDDKNQKVIKDHQTKWNSTVSIDNIPDAT